MADFRHLALEWNLIMSSKVGDHDDYQMKGLIEIIIKTYIYTLLKENWISQR